MSLLEQEDRLMACVHCGFCLPVCPTYRVLGDEADSPRGRLHLMRAVAEGRLPAVDPAFQTHMDRCLGCRACEPVCPAGVEYGFLLEEARSMAVEARRNSLLVRLLLAVFGRRLPSRVAGAAGRLLRVTGIPGALARLLPPTRLLHPLRTGMAMLASSRPDRLRRRGGGGSVDPAARPGAGSGTGRVGILAGCVQPGLFSRVGEATRKTLEANGYEVVPVADAGCCGALHAHSGELGEARAAARRQIGAFTEAGVDWVAVDAAGCGAAMKGYGGLLEDDPEWREAATAFSRGVRDVSELLAMAGPRTGGRLELRVAYDPPCHLLHAQGVEEPVRALLAAIPGVEPVPVRNAEGCCGGAGIYGITHRELGGQIGSDKVAALAETGADVVATGNPGCMMQIGGGLLLSGIEMGVVHPVELLHESYRRGGIYASGHPGHGAGNA